MGLLAAFLFGVVRLLGAFNTPYDWITFFILLAFGRTITLFKFKEINF